MKKQKTALPQALQSKIILSVMILLVVIVLIFTTIVLAKGYNPIVCPNTLGSNLNITFGMHQNFTFYHCFNKTNALSYAALNIASLINTSSVKSSEGYNDGYDSGQFCIQSMTIKYINLTSADYNPLDIIINNSDEMSLPNNAQSIRYYNSTYPNGSGWINYSYSNSDYLGTWTVFNLSKTGNYTKIEVEFTCGSPCGCGLANTKIWDYNYTFNPWLQVGAENIINYNSSTCVQETANVSTACGGLSTGLYSSSGSWDSLHFGRDGIWDENQACTDANSGASYFVNYTKPAASTSATMQVLVHNYVDIGQDNYTNVTIPQQCFDYSVISINFKGGYYIQASWGNWSCYNGSEFIVILSRDESDDGNTNLYRNCFGEEQLIWNISSSTTSTEYAFNVTGLFSDSRQTTDFYQKINDAVNNGACDCTGCMYSNPAGNYTDDLCAVPFKFHSDAYGIFNSQIINFQSADNFTVVEISPANATFTYLSLTNFSCEAFGNNLTNISLNIFNASSGLVAYSSTNNVSGNYNLSNFYNVNLATNNYLWGCSASDSTYSISSANYSLTVSLEKPAIFLSYPNSTSFSNFNNIYFNYTAYHAALNMSVCELWGNWNSGWHKNQTKNNVVSNVPNYFMANFSNEGNFIWNINCNTTSNYSDFSINGNYTFILDSSFPLLAINTPSGSFSSKTFDVNVSVSDLSPTYCYFNITRGASLEVANTQIPNCASVSTTVSGYADYVVHVFVNDSVGYFATANQSFTVNAAASSQYPVSSGGGFWQQLTTPVEKANVCDAAWPPLVESWNAWKSDFWSWQKFKKVWYAYWAYSLCKATASLIPVE